MGAMLDVIGATIAGGVLILFILNSMFTIQALAFNTNMASNLIDITETVSSNLSTILDLVGSDIDSRPNAIWEADSTKFRFQAEFDVNDDGHLTDTDITIEQITDGNSNKQLLVYHDDDTNNILLGPFRIDNNDNLNFTYYDEFNNVIGSGASLNDIRSVRVEIPFYDEGMNLTGSQQRDLVHNIVIWKFFKNLYLST